MITLNGLQTKWSSGNKTTFELFLNSLKLYSKCFEFHNYEGFVSGGFCRTLECVSGVAVVVLHIISSSTVV